MVEKVADCVQLTAGESDLKRSYRNATNLYFYSAVSAIKQPTNTLTSNINSTVSLAQQIFSKFRLKDMCTCVRTVNIGAHVRTVTVRLESSCESCTVKLKTPYIVHFRDFHCT